jgi:AraC-like DNA-binding protein
MSQIQSRRLLKARDEKSHFSLDIPEEQNRLIEGNKLSYHPLFHSDFYTISDFYSYSVEKRTFKSSFTPKFCLNFTRKGYFTFHSFHKIEEEYNGRILLEKPGCEFTLKQQHSGEGSCTIFAFSDTAYEELKNRYHLQDYHFFSDPEQFSFILNANAESDYYHFIILQSLLQNKTDFLHVDSLVTELLDNILNNLCCSSPANEMETSFKRNHLRTMERAKEYLLGNYDKNITLLELSQYCYVSQFHFSRIFKLFTHMTPFQYLQNIRLKHAEILLRTTNLSVMDVCFQCGFSRLDYFSATFSKRYSFSPTKYKQYILTGS